MTEQAPYDPNSEKPSRRARAWSKAKQVTAVAVRGVVQGAKAVAPEAKRAAVVAGRAIPPEARREILRTLIEPSEARHPEKRDLKHRFMDVAMIAGPIAVRAIAADIHNRIMNPSSEQAATGTPFEAPTQRSTEPGFTHGFETAHPAGQTGSAHTRPYAKV